MMRRKAAFIEIEEPPPGAGFEPELVHAIRNFAGMGYVVVPVIDVRAAAAAAELVLALRRVTGAGVTDAVAITPSIGPSPIWAAARRHDLDLAQSVAVTRMSHAAGALASAGVRVERSLRSAA